MLSKATFDDEQPTPGYLYREINGECYSINSPSNKKFAEYQIIILCSIKNCTSPS